MYELAYRLLVIAWFVGYMAAVYLALHIAVAWLSRSPESRLLWFFSIVTSPLTRRVRRLMPPEASENRVRLVALVASLLVMFGARLTLAWLGQSPFG